MAEDVRRCVEECTTGNLFDLDAFRICLGDKATGAVRVSLGIVSNFEDVARFLDFLAGFRDRLADDSYAGTSVLRIQDIKDWFEGLNVLNHSITVILVLWSQTLVAV